MSYNPKICVYAIAKDEQENAAKWYERVKCADFVVVLDTGSSDRTVEILRGLGASVFTKKYDSFRFDRARNDALDIALARTDCDVFLALDLDEFPDDGWCDAIRERWDPKVHTRGTYDLYIGSSPIPGSMNWLHDRSWRWRYPCHEAMERRDGGGTTYHVSNQLNLRGVVKVRHPDVPGGHGAIYLPLLRTRWEENKGDQDSAAYLLRELVGCGLYEEARSFGSGLDLLGLFGNPGSWALTHLADAFDQGGEREKAKALLYHAWRLWPAGRTAPVRLATILCAEDDPAGAEAVLRRAIFESGERRGYGLFLDNEDVWLWRALDWLGVAVYAQGRFAEARAIFLRALAGANTDQARAHIRDNIRFCDEKITTEHTEHTEREKAPPARERVVDGVFRVCYTGYKERAERLEKWTRRVTDELCPNDPITIWQFPTPFNKALLSTLPHIPMMDEKPGTVGATIGNYRAIKTALGLGMERILVMEDDCRFGRGAPVYDCIDRAPEDADILMLDHFCDWGPTGDESGLWKRVRSAASSACIVYNRRAMERIVELYESVCEKFCKDPMLRVCDHWTNEWYLGTGYHIYAAVPNLAIQTTSPGESNCGHGHSEALYAKMGVKLEDYDPY